MVGPISCDLPGGPLPPDTRRRFGAAHETECIAIPCPVVPNWLEKAKSSDCDRNRISELPMLPAPRITNRDVTHPSYV